eukprot:5092994-Pyramimonas_sp.AAC.1
MGATSTAVDKIRCVEERGVHSGITSLILFALLSNLQIILITFGLSRHRDWSVGMKPIGCSLGSRGRPLRDASWR